MTRQDWEPERIRERQEQVKVATAARGKHHSGNGFGLNLANAVKFWPTPQASDCRDRGNLSSGVVHRRREKGKQLGLSQVVSEISGALNPTWVEWLMGFPTGHTDLKPSETQSSPK
jgi:DNA (cytosine-5)-methyltransferase 1